MTGRTFWSITTSKSDTVKSTSGVPDAWFRRYSTYHGGILALYQAVMGPTDSSCPWESRRTSDTGPSYFCAGSYLPAPLISHRANPASPEPAHRFDRSLSRASGNRLEEEGLMSASQAALLNEFLRPARPSRRNLECSCSLGK